MKESNQFHVLVSYKQFKCMEYRVKTKGKDILFENAESWPTGGNSEDWKNNLANARIEHK